MRLRVGQLTQVLKRCRRLALGQLPGVRAGKLVVAFEHVAEPLSQFGAQSDALQPLVEARLDLAQDALPNPVDENPVPSSALGSS